MRKEAKYNEFVVQFDGDEDRARQNMTIEQTAFEEHKDFTQLLTDAAMKPESSHASVSTQKFAIALSKDWISSAYNDIVAQNRMNVPYEIEVNVDTFNGKTRDGQNEAELIQSFIPWWIRKRSMLVHNMVLPILNSFAFGEALLLGQSGS